MSARRLRRAAAAVLAGLVLVAAAAGVSGQEKVPPDKLPPKVMEAMKARFPGAEFTSVTKETVDGQVIYDLEFKHKGRKCEMDIKEDGTIINIEREIAAKDLPAAVTKAVEQKYPKAALKEVMEIMEMKDRKEVLEGYEVVLETADKKAVELKVAPDGKVLEEEVDGKKVEKK